MHAALLAQHLGAKAAGPQLVAVAAREKSARDAERAARKPAEEARAQVAQATALAAARTPAPDRDKLSRLMAMVRARQERSAGAARPDAATRLQQLLAGEPGETISGHPLLVAALAAALALDARGAKELAAQLRDNPEPAVAAAARRGACP